MKKNQVVISQPSGVCLQWLKALTLSQKTFMISQLVSTKFQIIIQPHNSYFLKKVSFGEIIEMIILEKVQISPN